MPNAKRMIIIQKDLPDNMIRAKDRSGASPGNCPMVPKRINITAVAIPAMAIIIRGARQENQVRRNTVSKGPKIRLKGGAVCWTARAFAPVLAADKGCNGSHIRRRK